MNKKKIKFLSSVPEFDILKPYPASKAVPDWYRTMKGVKDGFLTVKKCIPFLDALTAGYVIPLYSDMTWNKETKLFESDSKIQINSDHYISQSDNVALSSEWDPQPHKFLNTWYIKTPKGYSTLFIHPLNREDLPFHSITGIVDTDKHPLIINFPFVLRKDFEGTIPAGTPMIQAIPFKRDDWDMEVVDDKRQPEPERQFEVMNAPFGWYKKNHWKRKLYQ